VNAVRPDIAKTLARPILWVVLAVAIATAAITTYKLIATNGCEQDPPGIRGARKVEDGVTKYFDGRCWTTRPAPPSDMPF